VALPTAYLTSTRNLDGILSAIQTAQAPPRFTLSFLDQTEAPKVLAERLQDAYADLFQLNRNANELVFIELANRADFSGGPAPQRTTEPVADSGGPPEGDAAKC